jgi:ABC-type spermidine/putrescine transport system permease subunit I
MTEVAGTRRMRSEAFIRGLFTSALTAPLTVAIVVFVAVPAAVFAAYSVWQVESFQIVHDYTLKNYRDVFTQPLYRTAVRDSFIIGITTALGCTVLAFVLAWAVRFHTTRWRSPLVLAIVASSVSSYLARLYAWRSILGTDGVINYALEKTHVTHGPLSFLIFDRFAVIVALVHIFLPFAFLPIYANLLEIDPDTLRAARMLGAGPIRTFLRVALPLASTGVAISFSYVLIFATGDYAVPSFLGGPSGIVAARVIADQFGVVFNWPLGAALSFVYMAILGLILGVFTWAVTYRARRLRA